MRVCVHVCVCVDMCIPVYVHVVMKGLDPEGHTVIYICDLYAVLNGDYLN